jgi:hypothetical protein
MLQCVYDFIIDCNFAENLFLSGDRCGMDILQKWIPLFFN